MQKNGKNINFYKEKGEKVLTLPFLVPNLKGVNFGQKRCEIYVIISTQKKVWILLEKVCTLLSKTHTFLGVDFT